MTQTSFDATAFRGTAAENYERYFVPAIGSPLAEDLVAAACLREGERVLDVACGTGVVARLAAVRVGHTGAVAGLDSNPGMLSVARSATHRELAIDWYETGAEAIPLADGSFDVVLCQMGLQFFADRPRALRQMRRVLRPGGRLLVNVPGPRPALFAAFADALARHIGPDCAAFIDVVFALHDAKTLRTLLADAGFDDVDVARSPKALRLPAPEDFLWQYVHSTPLAGAVAKASEARRSALESDLVARWQEFVRGAGMTVEVGVTTARGRQPGLREPRVARTGERAIEHDGGSHASD